MIDNLPTGRLCFYCGNVEYADDEPFSVSVASETFVIDCGGCPR